MAEQVPVTQRVNIYEPIINSELGLPPLVMRVVVTPVGMDNRPIGPRTEEYVCLGALPIDLKDQVIAAVKKLVPGS